MEEKKQSGEHIPEGTGAGRSHNSGYDNQPGIDNTSSDISAMDQQEGAMQHGESGMSGTQPVPGKRDQED